MHERAFRSDVLGGAFGYDVRAAGFIPLCFDFEAWRGNAVLSDCQIRLAGALAPPSKLYWDRKEAQKKQTISEEI